MGAVINFQKLAKLQQTEAKIRRHLFVAGHVANFNFNDIVGTSSQLKKPVSLARDFAQTDSAILIQGETGTGKEIFAQSVHNGSSRNQGPFVAINCAALPEQILESELFGYVGGAFTGASQKGKAGLFEIAHGGTLFLDEIAEMKYATQGKLLRVLQEKQVMRLGSDRVTPVDVRVISASNRPLHALVNQKVFRDDLYYRLNVLQLRLYPLRDRNEDIMALANYFLAKHATSSKRKPVFTDNALKELRKHVWLGNVRELRNVIERIIATVRSSKIDTDMVRMHRTTSTNQILGGKVANPPPAARAFTDSLARATSGATTTPAKTPATTPAQPSTPAAPASEGAKTFPMEDPTPGAPPPQ